MLKNTTTPIFLAIAVLSFVISYYCCQQTELKAPKEMGDKAYSILPNKDALVWMSLGQREFVADLIWVRSLQYNTLHDDAHLVENFADAIIALDPDFKSIYRWAAVSTVFSSKITAHNVDAANHYLELGSKRFPLDPYYDYSIAINLISYYPKTTPEVDAEHRSQAISHLQLAMQKPNADPNISFLITGLLSESGDAAKIAFIQQALLTETDPEIKKNLQTRLILLSETSDTSALMVSAKRDQWQREHHEYLPTMLDFMISSEDSF